MRFTVFDVGHGFCAALIADNGNLMMFDCGHSSTAKVRPYVALRSQGQQSIERLFITNYDQDHISDIQNIWQHFQVHILHRNESITAARLRQVKLQGGPLTSQMSFLLSLINQNFTGGPPTHPPTFPRVSWDCFHVNYPTLQDTNNLSLVTVLNCAGTTFMLPGDIERTGWQHLLLDARFRACLPGIDVFIASHHGRESGFYAPLFDDHNCEPNYFVFSDSAILHATQQMSQNYAARARGTNYNGRRRFVFSTRNDGQLDWTF